MELYYHENNTTGALEMYIIHYIQWTQDHRVCMVLITIAKHCDQVPILIPNFSYHHLSLILPLTHIIYSITRTSITLELFCCATHQLQAKYH